MKLIIQIPSYNEADSLPRTIGGLPRHVCGFSEVEFLVIDDGSEDETSRVARESGADYVVRHCGNRGLAAAFQTGLTTCLELGANVVVNTDADNQYCAGSIPELVRPIVTGEAEMVVGDRRTSTLQHFSFLKRRLQTVGSWGIRKLTGLPVSDSVCGFRAFSQDAAARLNVVTKFSYTIETLFQAREHRLKVVSVPIRVNPTERPSRLFRSTPRFLFYSCVTIFWTCLMTRPLLIFGTLSTCLFAAGATPVVRFLCYYVRGTGDGKIQSLVIGSVLLGFAGCSLVLGTFAELLAINRNLLQRNLARQQRAEPPGNSRTCADVATSCDR